MEGDITKQSVDAIVNSAHQSLRGGGGVDGAIHAAAGEGLRLASDKIGHCNLGDVVITPGFRLPAKYIIHTVAPVYGFYKKEKDAELLASCYRRSLELAQEKGLRTIAFPSLSTGAYGYPIIEAVKIALSTIMAFLQKPSSIQEVRMVLFTPEDKAVYEYEYEQMRSA